MRQPRPRRHDDGRRHARDRLRARGRPTRSRSWTAASSSSTGRPRRCSTARGTSGPGRSCRRSFERPTREGEPCKAQQHALPSDRLRAPSPRAGPLPGHPVGARINHRLGPAVGRPLDRPAARSRGHRPRIACAPPATRPGRRPNGLGRDRSCSLGDRPDGRLLDLSPRSHEAWVITGGSACVPPGAGFDDHPCAHVAHQVADPTRLPGERWSRAASLLALSGLPGGGRTRTVTGAHLRHQPSRHHGLTCRVRTPWKPIHTRVSSLTIVMRALWQCGQRITVPAPR